MRGPVRCQMLRRKIPRPVRRQRGQMLVETAIIMPIMIFVILGTLQLMLMQHAKVMTEYAAYNAARAGIVHNMNRNVMRNAAMWSVLPLYGRTDKFDKLLVTWGLVKLASEITEAIDTTGSTVEQAINSLIGMNIAGAFAPDTSIVDLDVTSPRQRDFADGLAYQNQQEGRALSIDPQGPLDYPEDEVDFDQRELIMQTPQIGRLALEVRVLVPLRIPILNWIFFQLWYAQEQLQISRMSSSLQEWAALQTRVNGNPDRMLEDEVLRSEGTGVFDDWVITTQRTKEHRMLRDIAKKWNVYLIPMRATYAMQMQSNLFRRNMRDPVWFSLEDI